MNNPRCGFRYSSLLPTRWPVRVRSAAVVALALLLVSWGARRLTPVSAADHLATTRPGGAQSASEGIGPAGPATQPVADRADHAASAPLPTGRGILVGHVEAGGPGEYAPDRQDAAFSGVAMTAMSGPGKVSGHATATARVIYGPHGMAPGIDQVLLWSASDWFYAGCLHVGSAAPPDAHGARLFNHSWISATDTFSSLILNRVDYLIDHDDVVMVVGVNNGRATPVPTLLASAYNVISVGLVNGQSSGGQTTSDGLGRCKPEIVAPGDLTSLATPAVAAVCARLLEVADNFRQFPQARRAAVIKAVLLAGAQKPAGWAPKRGAPLDEHLGAGSVSFDHSYAIFTAGPCMPGPLTAPLGWDFHPLGRGVTAAYDFTVAKPTGEVSLVLVWNRRIAGPSFDQGPKQMVWDDTASLAHFDLALVRLTGKDTGEPVAFSASPVDNLQHIYIKSLPPGHYRFGVRRHDDLDQEWHYALAWRIEGAGISAAPQPQEPAKP